MEVTVERGFSTLGTLFHNVITDLKVGMPLWEDFIAKASKLHSQLKSTILATTSYLDSFQKIADLATNARGATKEIGKALTRIILRHKAVEARLKTFTSSILDCLILPLQDKVEEWRKTITQLDKDHAKEHKKALQEIKKRSSDTLRLQKKVRKGKCEIQRTLNSALQDTTHKFIMLEEAEKNSVRMAFIEERSHFCLLVACLKPVVDEEVAMMGEMTHLQEILEQLLKNTADPYSLPPSSEQIINDVKGLESTLSLQTPPSSPSSVGSRKSSVCSMSSLNSSSSGSTKSRSSPSHHLRNKIEPRQMVPAGPFRLSSVSSQDSGFTSQDTLLLRPPIPPPSELARQVFATTDRTSPDTSSTLSSPSSLCAGVSTATWPNLQDSAAILMTERPHTISTAYEKGHQRAALTVHTFEPLEHATYQHFQSTIDIPEKKVTPSTWMPKLGHASSLGSVALPDFNRTPPNQVVPLPLPCANSTDTLDIRQTLVDESEEFEESLHSKSSEDTSSIAEQSELSSENESSKYCTLPRYCDGQVIHSPLIKSFSTVGRSSTLRAISSHAQKPPLPIRRTSSISSQHGLLAVANESRISNCATLPRKLRETAPNAKRIHVETISSDLKAALENRKRLIEEDEKETKEGNEESEEQPKNTPIEEKRNSIVTTRPVLSRAPEALIEMANARTSPRSSSPRMGSLARRKSEPGRYQTLDERIKRDASPKNKLSLPHEAPSTALQQNNSHFLNSLNAKLAQHVHKQMPATQMGVAAAEQCANRRKSAGDAGSRWQQKLAERPSVDPTACRESLLDQIRKGTMLRQAKSNDRSLPRLK
uniref:IMD domain-containing protein n=1 Tax=Strigamia maritima TaxID=126957 RepID=T1J2R7_STRMM